MVACKQGSCVRVVLARGRKRGVERADARRGQANALIEGGQRPGECCVVRRNETLTEANEWLGAVAQAYAVYSSARDGVQTCMLVHSPGWTGSRGPSGVIGSGGSEWLFVAGSQLDTGGGVCVCGGGSRESRGVRRSCQAAGDLKVHHLAAGRVAAEASRQNYLSASVSTNSPGRLHRRGEGYYCRAEGSDQPGGSRWQSPGLEAR